MLNARVWVLHNDEASLCLAPSAYCHMKLSLTAIKELAPMNAFLRFTCHYSFF